MKIGEILLRQGVIDRETLDRAVEIQKTWTSPIGTILMALGIVNSRQIALALAEQFSLSYRDPGAAPPDPAVFRRVLSRVSESFLREHSALPLGEEDGKIAFATSDPTDPVFGKELPERLGCGIVLYVASERDVSRAFMSVFKQTYIDETVMGLFYRTPEQSAIQTFTNAQLAAIFLFVTALLAGAYYRPIAVGTAVVLAINILYLISILFKFAASMAGAHTEILQQVSDEEVAALKDEDLPVYTVLLPMYREPVVVATLIESVKKFDYPTSKLDVKILLEEDDVETYEALRRIQPPAHFEIVRVPYSFPKTKPKACNYGLLFARGAFLTIFDAEDIPDRDQLKKAFVAFAKGPENLVCVQAALNYFNARQNFLTKLFTLEYSYWFDYMLPGIEALRFPIPLGGTSNHFRVEMLRALGGWDPFNVTEDADLGIRASARGYRIATVNSTTYEEANSRAGNWIRQRSRWIKGYMMTYLVHMRHPVRFVRRAGWRAFWGLQLLVGGTFLTFLINPVLWMVFIFWLAFRPQWMDAYFPPAVVVISNMNLILGNAVAIYMNMLAVFRRQYFWLTPYALLNPVYWILHSIAAYKALGQLLTNPFYWEKTTHGLASETEHPGS